MRSGMERSRSMFDEETCPILKRFIKFFWKSMLTFSSKVEWNSTSPMDSTCARGWARFGNRKNRKMTGRSTKLKCFHRLDNNTENAIPWKAFIEKLIAFIQYTPRFIDSYTLPFNETVLLDLHMHLDAAKVFGTIGMSSFNQYIQIAHVCLSSPAFVQWNLSSKQSFPTACQPANHVSELEEYGTFTDQWWKAAWRIGFCWQLVAPIGEGSEETAG